MTTKENAIVGTTYRVVTTPSAQAPSFVGRYEGEEAGAGVTLLAFTVAGRLPGMPLGTKQWYPRLLPEEIVSWEIT